MAEKKEINLGLSVAALVKEYPELKDILASLGFGEILQPLALRVMGSITTLPRGAKIKNIPLDEVLRTLQQAGYTVKGQEDARDEAQKTAVAARVQPLSVAELAASHPLRHLQDENTGLARLLSSIEKTAEGADGQTALIELRQLYALYSHYGKKDNVIMPLLYRYGVTGPSQVMWNVDDEIKDELSAICRPLQEDSENFPIYKGRIMGLLQRIQDMIYKEEQVLFPLCLRFFTTEDWYQVDGDFDEFAPAFGAEREEWPEARAWLAARQQAISTEEILQTKITLPTGECTVGELRGIFALLPIDITFIDAENNVRFFLNEGHVFSRPQICLGQDVMNCHPPRIVPIVRNLVDDFRHKRRDHMTVARRIKGRPVMVKYQAVYDAQGTYIGTVEFVQDCQEILDSFKG